MQRMSSIGESEKEKSKKESGVCGNTTKDIVEEEASMSHQERGIGSREKAKDGRGRRSGTYDQAMRSTARRVEENPGTCPMTKGAEALWRRYP